MRPSTWGAMTARGEGWLRFLGTKRTFLKAFFTISSTRTLRMPCSAFSFVK
jgi:hypothetical protein